MLKSGECQLRKAVRQRGWTCVRKEGMEKMKFLRQFALIMAVTFVGELLHYLLPLPVPASIYGLVLMLIALCSGKLPLDKVEQAADFLVAVMPVMFIPAGVGLMTNGKELGEIWLPFTVIIVVSTVAVMAVTGKVTQWVIRREKKGKEK